MASVDKENMAPSTPSLQDIRKKLGSIATTKDAVMAITPFMKLTQTLRANGADEILASYRNVCRARSQEVTAGTSFGPGTAARVDSIIDAYCTYINGRKEDVTAPDDDDYILARTRHARFCAISTAIDSSSNAAPAAEGRKRFAQIRKDRVGVSRAVYYSEWATFELHTFASGYLRCAKYVLEQGYMREAVPKSLLDSMQLELTVTSKTPSPPHPVPRAHTEAPAQAEAEPPLPKPKKQEEPVVVIRRKAGAAPVQSANENDTVVFESVPSGAAAKRPARTGPPSPTVVLKPKTDDKPAATKKKSALRPLGLSGGAARRVVKPVEPEEEEAPVEPPPAAEAPPTPATGKDSIMEGVALTGSRLPAAPPRPALAELTSIQEIGAVEEEEPEETPEPVPPQPQPVVPAEPPVEQIKQQPAAAAPTAAPAPGPEDKDRYAVVNGHRYAKLEVIGRGGSSKVFKVMSGDKKIYALKRVKLGGLEKAVVDGYLNEVNLLSQFRGSEHVVQLVDSEVDLKTGLLFMVMEFGDVDLNKMLQKNSTQMDANGRDFCFQENYIRLYWQQMLEAVHAAHVKRIIHADLKPANFLCVEGRLKLIDFGIAKAIHNDTTNIMRENQVGTLNYMAPEALLGESEDWSKGTGPQKMGRASDIWSLGCILYQMVFGHTPFSKMNLLQRMRAFSMDEVPIPFPEGGLEPTNPIREVITLCLRKNPRERPSIPDLLRHQMLAGSSSAPSGGTVISKDQIRALLTQVSALTGSALEEDVSDLIYKQLQDGGEIDIKALLAGRQ